MKTPPQTLSALAASLAMMIGLSTLCAQIPSNGNFEQSPADLVVTPKPPSADLAVGSWRVFNVMDTAEFTVKVVNTASDGAKALRLESKKQSNESSGFGLDRNYHMIPISHGTAFKLSFDAALVSGDGSITVTCAEHDGEGKVIRQDSFPFTIAEKEFQTFDIEWSPKSPNANWLNIFFTPLANDGGESVILLDNVRLEPQS